MLLDLLTGRVAGWAVAALALAAAGAAAVWMLEARVDGAREAGDKAGYARAQADYTARALAAEREARRIEHEAAQEIARLEADHAKRKRDFDRAAADARGELGRLRDLLAQAGAAAGGAPPTGPAAAGRCDGPAPATVVAGECASQLLAMAEAADAVRARLVTLQAYVRGLPNVASMAASAASAR